MKHILSPRAQADIENIWDYTFQNWGLTQAEFYIRGIQAAIETVASESHKGKACDDVREGYYKYRIGSHIIFYRLANSIVDVVRVLHQRMDYDQHL